jgi:2-polyprenyl-3-methyl-5-hydroxy-6-metoxy-1,4-benzoquinol methylase
MSQIETLSQPQAVSMADEWFDYATADHFWMQWRHRLIIRALKRAGGRVERALEIGCGHGVARDMLERDCNFAVDGCDLNQAALEMASPGRGKLYVYDIFDQAPSMLERYDVVFLLDVIEHIEDDASFVVAALRHLRPGGLLMINVPASMLLYSKYDVVAGHVRRYTRSSLAQLLRHCGLVDESVESWGLLMVPLLLARKAVLSRSNTSATIRTGFVPPNKASQVLLHAMKDIETTLPFTMPFGTSILAWARLPTRS